MSDVLIVGAGPAGIAAAVRASESGAGVCLVDENPGIGGQIWRGESAPEGQTQAGVWFRRFRKCDVRTEFGARVVSVDPSGKALLVERESGAFELRYRRLILAPGARELLLPFPGWTLPGVAGVGGLQALVKAGMPVRRKRVVIAGSGPLLLAAAAYLREHDADVLFIAEQTNSQSLARFGIELLRHREKLRQAAALQWQLLGVPYYRDCFVVKGEGRGRLERLHLRQGTKTVTIDVDFAGVAYGLTPNTELAELLGCDIATYGARDGVVVDRYQQTTIPDIYCAGESTGIGGVDLSIAEGEIAGFTVAGDKVAAREVFARGDKARGFARAVNHAFRLREELRRVPDSGTIVCRCEDVRHGALAECTSAREAKLHTRFGMGPCQGRVCGAAASFLFGWKPGPVRPPIFPCRVGTLESTET